MKINKPTIIETPSGDRMAIIPLADYEQLVSAAEDAADIRAADEVKRRLAIGEDELVPAEFAHRILNGENPVRVWREYRGLSAKDLAERIGISETDLSKIESGEFDGNIEIMRKIALSLGVGLDDL